MSEFEIWIIVIGVWILLEWYCTKKKKITPQQYYCPAGTGCNDEDNQRMLDLVCKQYPPLLFEKRSERNGTTKAQELAFEVCRIMEKEGRVINYKLLMDRCIFHFKGR